MSVSERIKKIRSKVGNTLSSPERTGAVSGLMLLGVIVGASSAIQGANALTCNTRGEITSTDITNPLEWSNSWNNHSWCWTWSWCWDWDAWADSI